MNIDPIKRNQDMKARAVARARSPESPASATPAPVVDEIEHGKWIEQLKAMPDTRPEVIALGRKLAEDPGYPPDELLDRLAEMLVDDVESFDLEEQES